MSSVRYIVLLLVLFSFGGTAVASMVACTPDCSAGCDNCIDGDLADGATVADQCVTCAFNGVNEQRHELNTNSPSSLDSSYYERVFSDWLDVPDPFPPRQPARS